MDARQEGPKRDLPHWSALLNLSEAELAEHDVAAINLACAAELPGTEHYDPRRCLKCLDDWAVGISQVTTAALVRDFRTNAAQYDHSEPLFRMVTLVRALQSRCGVRYNPARVDPKPDDPFRADDQFVHGAVLGPGGTCASLPVVYAAVGRRIGYPVRLAYCRGHIFCRWDDPHTGTRVNVEGTSSDGVNCHPDEHYRKWPRPFDARAEAEQGYLRSLSARAELAEFLLHRSAVWESMGEYWNAVDTAACAAALDPECLRYAHRVASIVRKWSCALRSRGQIGDGFYYPERPTRERRWSGVPWSLEAAALWLDGMERGTTIDWEDAGAVRVRV